MYVCLYVGKYGYACLAACMYMYCCLLVCPHIDAKLAAGDFKTCDIRYHTHVYSVCLLIPV